MSFELPEGFEVEASTKSTEIKKSQFDLPEGFDIVPAEQKQNLYQL